MGNKVALILLALVGGVCFLPVVPGLVESSAVLFHQAQMGMSLWVLFVLIAGMALLPAGKSATSRLFLLFLIFSFVVTCSHHRSSWPMLRLLRATGIVVCLGCLWVTGRSYVYERKWAEAYEEGRHGNLRPALTAYSEIAPRLSAHPGFLYNYAVLSAEAGHIDRSDSLLRAYRCYGWDADCALLAADNAFVRQQWKRAMECYEEAHFMKPVLFYPLYRMMQINLVNGHAAEARKLARELTEKIVKVPSEQIDWMVEEARSVLKTTK